MKSNMKLRRISLLALVASMILAGCGGSEDTAPETTIPDSAQSATTVPGGDTATTQATTATTVDEATPAVSDITIVATTSILGDVVGNIVGDAATVEVIMGIGADPHDFQPSAQQAALIGSADLVIANGLGLEEGLIDVIEAAESDGVPVLELAAMLDPIPFADPHGHGEEKEDDHDHGDEDDHSDEAGDEHAHGDEDPHFWQDPARMATAVGLIADKLSELDPAVDWRTQADAYAEELMALDAEVESLLAGVPAESRKIVTNHEAFGYFAARYGFEVIGTVIPGGSTLAEPSAAELADLISEIREEGVTAIFAETTNPSALADAVAAELGTDVGVYDLYSDSLGGPGTPGDTYAGLIRSNARTVADALG